MKRKASYGSMIRGKIVSYIYKNTKPDTREEDVQPLVRQYLEEYPEHLPFYTQDADRVLKRCRGAYRDKRNKIKRDIDKQYR